MRISEVIGLRIRAQREERGWSQAHLGSLIGLELDRDWTRQAVSAAEKGKRQFTAAELVAFSSVLEVSITYLLMPPPDAGPIEYERGVIAPPAALNNALDVYRSMNSQQAAFTEAGQVFFRHLGELRQIADQVQVDLDHMIGALGTPPSLRSQQKAEKLEEIGGLLDAVKRRPHDRSETPGGNSEQGPE